MTIRHAPLFVAVAILIALLPNRSLAQDVPRWQVPGAVVPVDFTDPKRTPRKKLTQAGLAWQLPVSFVMLRDKVTLSANVPEQGSVELVLDSGDALVNVTTTADGPNKFKIEVQSTLGRMSVVALEQLVRSRIRELLAEPRKEAEAEAKNSGPERFRIYLRQQGKRPPIEKDELRKAFIERRTLELGEESLRGALEKLVEKRPRWVTQPDQAKWLKASDEELHEEYLQLLALDVAEEHLQKCGFKLDLAKRNFDKLIIAKFTGLYAIATGNSESTDPEIMKAVRSFTREELAALVKALTVKGACQFIPATDAGDDNSQWFNAQRVGTSISTVPSVRIVGRLHAAEGDRSDWWTLIGYDEDKTRLKFADDVGFRYELYESPSQQTCLRVIATRDEPFAYSFELLKRSSNGEGRPVVVHESPGKSDAKFPF